MNMIGGGAMLPEIYQKLKKLQFEAENDLGKLESLEFSNEEGSNFDELPSSIDRNIAEIRSLLRSVYFSSIINQSSRPDHFKLQLGEVAKHADSLKESLDKYVVRKREQTLKAKQKTELLGRCNGEPSHVMIIHDDYSQSMRSVRNSSKMLEECTSSGTIVLARQAELRERLKMAHRKSLDILNTVGMTNSVLRLIDRCHRVDQWIKYAGMIITIVILFAFISWTRK